MKGKGWSERAGLGVAGCLVRSLHGVPMSPKLVNVHHWMPVDDGLISTFREFPHKTPHHPKAWLRDFKDVLI